MYIDFGLAFREEMHGPREERRTREQTSQREASRGASSQFNTARCPET